MYDLDGIYNLLGAMVKRAIHDAQRDPKAADWLDDYCPCWRRYESAQRGIDKSVGQEQRHGMEKQLLLPQSTKR